ncbi:MAG: AmmeMemoRadiSam system protein B [Candidatus Altiarchaeota archaeon]
MASLMRSRRKADTDAILLLGFLVILAVFAYKVYTQGSMVVWNKAVEDGDVPGKTVVAVRKPVVAGAFYPSDPGKLAAMIDEYLGKAKKSDAYGIRGLVSPHAGYVYSGPTAAYGYKQLEGMRYETVIVMGPSHRHGFKGASIPNVTHYETPLGLVELSPKISEMYGEDVIVCETNAHAGEHSVEVQIPFLQRVLQKFKLIPIVVGDIDPEKLAEALEKYVDEDTLIIASTDLSHYHQYDDAVGMDDETVKAVAALDFEAMRECEACGKTPTLALMSIAEKNGWGSEVLDYRNSGDTAGDNSSVVGYASIAFYDGLDMEEQEFLVELARETLNSHYADGSLPEVDESQLTDKLERESACFVTLHKHGDLRGCIGHLSAMEPLYECVIQNALNAALHDGRFNPVKWDELEDLDIEVSVLSEPRILPHESPEDLLEKLVPGTDGVVIKYGWGQSTYLPVVWEQLPEKEDFLNRLCLKQGSPEDCWKSSKAEIYTYQAQDFSEVH